MPPKKKNGFWGFVDKAAKLVGLSLAVGAVLGTLGTGIGFILKAAYAEEIKLVWSTVEFGIHARDSIIPQKEREHEEMIERVTELEKKHSGGHAIGLRWSEKNERVEFRSAAGRMHEAHFVRGGWWYFDNGQWMKVYP